MDQPADCGGGDGGDAAGADFRAGGADGADARGAARWACELRADEPVCDVDRRDLRAGVRTADRLVWIARGACGDGGAALRERAGDEPNYGGCGIGGDADADARVWAE